MEIEALLKKAQTIREQEHRLKPSLRLKTVEEVVNFIHSKGLVSMLGGNELPSLISALRGKPWKPTGKGFTSWLEWWEIKVSGQDAGHVLMEIPRRKDIIGTRIFRNSKTFVSERLWPILDPIVAHYQDLAKKHKILSQLEWKILDTLAEKGPTRTDRLRVALKLEGKQHTTRFHRSLAQLENHGLIVGYEDPNPEKHLHAAIWNLWDRRIQLPKKTTRPSYQDAMTRLLEKMIEASVLVPEKEVPRWFPWEGSLLAKEELIKRGRVVREDDYLVTTRIAKRYN
ncbi:MAG TPA: hypothetical protein VIH83_00600 [Candidatus Bathyarchaeia archaeon]